MVTGSQLLKERDADEELGVRDVRDGDAVAAGELERAQRRLDAMATVCAGSIITPSLSAEQPVVFDQRRDPRLPALSPHRWPAGCRWWLQPPPDTSWEWTGAGRVQSVCTIKSVPFIGLDLTPSSRGVANRKTRTLLTFS